MTFEQYEIIKTIAQGGNGVIYLAKHALAERKVAIKMLANPEKESKDSLQRFQKEAVTSCSLDHPGIVKVFAYGLSTDERPYLVMEHLEGITLGDYLAERKRLDLDKFLLVFTQICSALDYAHSRGVIHRDLKPGNIMLCDLNSSSGMQVKILDFGIARNLIQSENGALSRPGEILGSPAYMSPEQCQGKEATAASDIYSLACVMFEALCGQPPFSAENLHAMILKQTTEEAPSLKARCPKLRLPLALDALIHKCLSKSPANRVGSAAELAKELEKAAAGPTPDRVKHLLPSALLSTLLIVAFITFQNYGKAPAPKYESVNWQKLHATITEATRLRINHEDKKAAQLYRGIINQKEALQKLVGKRAAPLIYEAYRGYAMSLKGNNHKPRLVRIKAWEEFLENAENNSLHTKEIIEADRNLAKLYLGQPPVNAEKAGMYATLAIAMIDETSSKEKKNSDILNSSYLADLASLKGDCLEILGRIDEMNSKLKSAEAKLNEALKLKVKKNAVESICSINENLCRTLYKEGRFGDEESLEKILFSSVTQELPCREGQNILRDLCSFFIEQKDFPKADKTLAQILEIAAQYKEGSNAERSRINALAGRLAFEKGELGKAKDFAEEAKAGFDSSNKTDRLDWQSLGDLFKRLGQKSAAEDCLKKAAKARMDEDL
ncbi:MAG: protein kinase [Candidatus Obscuribacterales bacterium]|nr:protein kinase [Candidatus Obscuribacterales bacterium]